MTHATKWLALAFAAASFTVGAQGAKKYELPDKTTLELNVPAGWKDELREAQSGMPPTIAFSPGEGARFEVYVTPISRPGPNVPMPTAEQLRDAVQRAADNVKPQAAETFLPVEELTGAKGPGYYFSATDKEPKPGEFKYLTQGMLLAGDVVLSFSILTNDGQEKVKDDAMAMLRGAAQTK